MPTKASPRGTGARRTKTATRRSATAGRSAPRRAPARAASRKPAASAGRAKAKPSQPAKANRRAPSREQFATAGGASMARRSNPRGTENPPGPRPYDPKWVEREEPGTSTEQGPEAEQEEEEQPERGGIFRRLTRRKD